MSKLKLFSLNFVFVLLSLVAVAQVQDRGNINMHIGTLAIYNTLSIGYEFRGFIKNVEKHQLKPVIRGGIWSASLINKNKGLQNSIGLTYLFGKNHFLEFTSEYVIHYDKGLKGQNVVYIGSLYRPFLGYRYQKEGKNLMAKIGVGWKELVQIGIGYRI